MAGETAGQRRRAAMLEALAYLDSRVEVCRKTETEWANKYGHAHVGCATERAARQELELAIKEIARMANARRNARSLRAEVAERERFIAERRAATPKGSPDV